MLRSKAALACPVISNLARASAALLCAACFAADAPQRHISARQYLDDVKYLSSPGLQGRATGSRELDKAARYIAREFEKAGLQAPDGKSYYQRFPVSIRSRLGETNRVEYTIDGASRKLKFHEEFIPLSFSARASVSGSLVFAGYGITAPEYNYDDYAGIDVKGKIVVVLRHEPQEYESNPEFEGRIYTEHSQLFSKAINARAHGAIGVVYVGDTANHSGDALEKFVSVVSPADPGLPFVNISAAIADRWFQAAERDFKEVQQVIDKTLKPQSFAFPDTLQLSMAVDVNHRARQVNNVAGFLPGTSSEYIIVGAHYDHLGLGEQFSLAPNMTGTAHPGADDNASGTAGLLALARWFAAQPKPSRGVLFIAFAGEELGLLGSSFYVHHPLFPLDRAKLMINMDMIGRIREEKVYVAGAGRESPLRVPLERARERYGLDLDLDDHSVYGSSDHTSFRTKLIPFLFFFSGLHGDYHRPSDTWDKINAQSAARLVALIADLTYEYAKVLPRPQFAQTGGGNGTSGSTVTTQ